MDNPVRTFLREIGRIPLLTHSEEISYGRQVQKMMSLLEAKKTLALKLGHEPTSHEWALHVHMSETELKEANGRGQRAKHKMMEANLRLVVRIARDYQGRGLEFLDLVQEGSLGLLRGVEKFDPSKGYRFSSYCWHWIRQAITRAINEKSRTIRLPVGVTEKLNRIKRTQRQLSQQRGHTPTTHSLATELQMSQKQLLQYLEWSQQPTSLNQLVGDDGKDELGNMLADDRLTPSEYIMQSAQVEEVELLMAELTPVQRQVLSLRLGLVDGQELGFSEIGARFNVSKQRAQQIDLKARTKLNQRINERSGATKQQVCSCSQRVLSCNACAPDSTLDAKVRSDIADQIGSHFKNLTSEEKLAFLAVISRYLYFKQWVIPGYSIGEAIADTQLLSDPISDAEDIISGTTKETKVVRDVLLTLEGISNQNASGLIRFIAEQV